MERTAEVAKPSRSKRTRKRRRLRRLFRSREQMLCSPPPLSRPMLMPNPMLQQNPGRRSGRSEARRDSASVPDETAAAPPAAPASEALNEPASEAAVYNDERKKQAEEATEQRHLYAAKAATPSSLHGPENEPAGSPTAASTEQVEVDAQQLEVQPAPGSIGGSLKSLRLSGFSGDLIARPIHLPSGFPVFRSRRRIIACLPSTRMARCFSATTLDRPGKR